tara:strand:+ start:1281 stop:1664 length:384 start_codon:yes stop_codon:yes gene_type:complete
MCVTQNKALYNINITNQPRKNAMENKTFIIPTWNTHTVTAKVNSILTEAQIYNDALQNDEPVSVPSGRTWGQLLSKAQQIRIDCEEWLDSTTLGEGFLPVDWSVLQQIVIVLEYLLLQGKVSIKSKV